MKYFAKAGQDEMRRVFQIVAADTGMDPALIEKDFWVCFTLDHLFNNFPYRDKVVFKGGTSLSKVYGLINPSPKI